MDLVQGIEVCHLGNVLDPNSPTAGLRTPLTHIKDGKVIEEWEEMNMLSLMMQMGFELKPPGEAKD